MLACEVCPCGDGLKASTNLLVLVSRGSQASGEGLASMGQSFLYAGVKTVLMTRWQVQDDSTADLVKAYIEAAQAESPERAMRTARRRIYAGKRDPVTGLWAYPPASDAAWAPFVVLGQPRIGPMVTGDRR